MFAKTLADPTKSKEDRETALRWVVHLVGDLHQPLHCAERDHDKGGNSQLCWLLDQKGKPSNLHSVWDSGIIRKMMGKEKIADFAADIDKKIPASKLKSLASGTPTDWANASHDLAVRYAYNGVQVGTVPHLNQRYVDRAEPVIQEQLARAGIRLAMVLNKHLRRPEGHAVGNTGFGDEVISLTRLPTCAISSRP